MSVLPGSTEDVSFTSVPPCSQLSLQQEELEVEEFQLVEKLQQLGINAGISDDIA